jgi:ubiquinone/menaquinone biosynthesis C-methylase UbiE
MEKTLQSVLAQYETLPYPPRDPQDESKRLITTWLDSLFMINHYCFGGVETFKKRFRVLVAGGGTGDGTIYLAEQLRDSDAEIVHCDFSEASLNIAKSRAEMRGLDNIEWIHDSLLNLPELHVGTFDYINCSGVLHHLADPDAGLRALKAVLAPGGAIGLMVYGTYGRTGVYQMQKLLRRINGKEADTDTKLNNAKQVLNCAPKSNWFFHGPARDHRTMGDAGIYDLLLHSQDRSYTVEELYQWLHDAHDFRLQFTDVSRGNAPYQPALVAAPHKPEFLKRVSGLPLREQQAIAELLSGSLDIHCLYLTPGEDDRVAPYGDPDMVPFFCHEPITGPELSAFIHRHTQRPLMINHSHTGIHTEVNPGTYGKFILKYLDGKRSFAELFGLVRQEKKFKKAPPDDETLFDDFHPLYNFLNSIERMLLKHKSV